MRYGFRIKDIEDPRERAKARRRHRRVTNLLRKHEGRDSAEAAQLLRSRAADLEGLLREGYHEDARRVRQDATRLRKRAYSLRGVK